MQAIASKDNGGTRLMQRVPPLSNYTGLNIFLPAPHKGHLQVSGNSSKGTSLGILLFLQPFSGL